jgi:hypothetical protein
MRCKICQNEFTPDKYHSNQQVCSQAECQKIRQIQNLRDWRIKNPEYFKCRGQEGSWQQVRHRYSREWRKTHKEYLKEYQLGRRQQRREYMREYMRNKRNKTVQDASGLKKSVRPILLDPVNVRPKVLDPVRPEPSKPVPYTNPVTGQPYSAHQRAYIEQKQRQAQ